MTTVSAGEIKTLDQGYRALLASVIARAIRDVANDHESASEAYEFLLGDTCSEMLKFVTGRDYRFSADILKPVFEFARANGGRMGYEKLLVFMSEQ